MQSNQLIELWINKNNKGGFFIHLYFLLKRRFFMLKELANEIIEILNENEVEDIRY